MTYVITPWVRTDLGGGDFDHYDVLASELLGGVEWHDATIQTVPPTVNLMLADMNIDATQEATLDADNRFYVINAGKTIADCEAWLQAEGVDQATIDALAVQFGALFS